MPGMTMRQCKLCGQAFMGRTSAAYCCDAHRKKAARGYEARYRAANQEKTRERERRYRAANPEKRRQKERRYRAANAEKIREQVRKSNRKRAAVLAAVRELGLI